MKLFGYKYIFSYLATQIFIIFYYCIRMFLDVFDYCDIVIQHLNTKVHTVMQIPLILGNDMKVFYSVLPGYLEPDPKNTSIDLILPVLLKLKTSTLRMTLLSTVII